MSTSLLSSDDSVTEPTHTGNAVLQLRQSRIALSTRPFRARGCRVKRCDYCLLPQRLCLCQHIVSTEAKSLFALLMYDTEPLKPSNTGRLIADTLPETHAFLWSRTDTDPDLLALINHPDLQPYVVFPDSYCEPSRATTRINLETGKRPLFIMLDGTWPEARKMFRKSPYLDKFPVISLDLSTVSAYMLREAYRQEQHCTAEVAIALLDQMHDTEAAHILAQHFILFKKHYLASKFNRTVESITINPSRNA